MKIDIPINKALAAVEAKKDKEGLGICRGCYFSKKKNCTNTGKEVPCISTRRKDGRDVIFKLVDYK